MKMKIHRIHNKNIKHEQTYINAKLLEGVVASSSERESKGNKENVAKTRPIICRS